MTLYIKTEYIRSYIRSPKVCTTAQRCSCISEVLVRSFYHGRVVRYDLHLVRQLQDFLREWDKDEPCSSLGWPSGFYFFPVTMYLPRSPSSKDDREQLCKDITNFLNSLGCCPKVCTLLVFFPTLFRILNSVILGWLQSKPLPTDISLEVPVTEYQFFLRAFMCRSNKNTFTKLIAMQLLK